MLIIELLSLCPLRLLRPLRPLPSLLRRKLLYPEEMRTRWDIAESIIAGFRGHDGYIVMANNEIAGQF